MFFAFFQYVNGRRTSRAWILNYARRSTWTSCNKPFKLFIFYSHILILNALCVVVELPAIFILNFCHVFLFNLSHKNFWTFSGRALELLATKFWTSHFYFYFFLYETHTMQCMNFWLLSIWTSLYFALVTEKVWVFYRHRTALTFLFELLCVFLRNVKIGVLLETSNFFVIFNWTYWFYSLVIEKIWVFR